MSETTGEGVVIFDTSEAGVGALATGNNNLVSRIIDCRYCKQLSVQIITDGGAKVNWSFQVTNLSPTLTQIGRTLFGVGGNRDDTFASNSWNAVSTGQIAAGAGNQSAIAALGTSVHRAARVTLNWDATNGGGTTAKVFIVAMTLGAA